MNEFADTFWFLPSMAAGAFGAAITLFLIADSWLEFWHACKKDWHRRRCKRAK